MASAEKKLKKINETKGNIKEMVNEDFIVFMS